MTWSRLIGYWLSALTYSIVSAMRAALTHDARSIRRQLIGEWNADAVELDTGRTLSAETWIFRADGTAVHIPLSTTRFAVQFRYRIIRQRDAMMLQLVRSGFVAREATFQLIADNQLRLQWQNRLQPRSGRITSRSTLFQKVPDATGPYGDVGISRGVVFVDWDEAEGDRQA